MSSAGNGFSRVTEAVYSVEIWDRYTGATLCQFDQGEGNFGRTLDGLTTAEWSVPGGCEACECPIEERRHELVFVRDDWPEPAWIGPIVRTVDDSGQGTIRYNAVDRLYWWTGAPSARDVVHQTPNEVSVVSLVDELMGLADDYEPSNLQRLFEKSLLPPDYGLLVESKLQQGDSIWGVLVGLAKSVLDFAVVGEQLYWGAPEIPIEDGPQILPTHFNAPPILDRDAEAVVTRIDITGSGGVKGIWPPVEQDLGFGKRTEFISDTNLNTTQEATERAKELFELNKSSTIFVVTGDGSLSPDFPIPVNEMIPGRNFLVSAGGQCLQADDELAQLFNLVVEIRTEAGPTRQLREFKVAADFGAAGSLGNAERASG